MGDGARRGLLGGWTALVLLFLYAPLLVVVAFAFNANPRNVVPWRGFTLDWFGRVLADDTITSAVRTSLEVALPSALLATVLGTTAALGLRAAPPRIRAAYDTLAYLTLVTPVVVLGLASLIGFVVLGVPRGQLTVTLAHVVFTSSVVLLIVRGRMIGMDHEQEEAAYDLGASRWGVLRQVTLPRLAPAILAGGLLAFTYSWDDYVVASFVTGPEATTLPIRIFSSLRFGLTPAVNALGAMILAVNLAVIAVAVAVLRRGAADARGRRLGVPLRAGQ
jgi:ABC-type spermidine/putrescine transport system permease subunit II